jgi:hypothetical protein
VHWPLTHIRPPVQAFLQLPQLALSNPMSVQVSPQRVPMTQRKSQRSPSQVGNVAGLKTGHGSQLKSPQLFGSSLSTQLPLQSCWPNGHAHVPSEQLLPDGQTRPQMPQFELSDNVSTQLPRHSVSPDRHSYEQRPPTQVSVARRTPERHT